MDPFFFGDSKEPLYGIHHPPQGTAPQPVPVVICPPYGQEYMRSHRALRQLANLLARQGFHVLRFDYHGTGDSYGEPEHYSIEQWSEEALIACEEAIELAMSDTACLIGLRLGAIVACLAAERSTRIGHLVLWDPIVRGSTYQTELENHIAESPMPKANFVATDGTWHINGFPITARTMSQIEAWQLSEHFPERSTSVYHVSSSDTEENRLVRDGWSAHSQYRFRYIDAPNDWNYVDDFGGILLPQPVIANIVSHLRAICRNAP